MTDITVSPIFDQQSPKVWQDMAHIATSAVMAGYNTDSVPNLVNWHSNTDNIVFGAYDGDRMVGFIVGLRRRNTLHIDGVYVLPEYQNNRIGARLLNSAERAGALFARNADLIALTHAEKFYVRHGWKSIYNNVYGKMLRSMPGIVPVFKITPTIVRAYMKISGGYDIHRDMMPGDGLVVYVNDKSEIRAMAIARPDTKAGRFRAAKTVVSQAGAYGWLASSLEHAVNNIVISEKQGEK